MGWHFIIQFHYLFLRTEYHSGLNLLIGNDSHLLFFYRVYYAKKDAKRISTSCMQGSVICIHSKTAKHIFFDIRETSVFECPSDFLGLQPIQEV